MARGEPVEVEVEVVLVLEQVCRSVPVKLPAGSPISEAVRRSGLGGDTAPVAIGVYGTRRELDDPVRDGDRIEIYRALEDDPKAIRRRRAALHREKQRR